jgi:hypothetical protein
MTIVSRLGMVGELQRGTSRLSVPLNADNRSQRKNQWRLVWVAVFAVLLTACSGVSSRPSATSSTVSPPTLSRTFSSPGQVQPTRRRSSVSRSTTEIVPDMLGMTLAAARSALYAADVGKYSWLYGCYGSPKTGKVVKQTPGGGAKVARTTVIKIFLQADNCPTTLPMSSA